MRDHKQWLGELLGALEASGEVGRRAAAVVRRRGIRLSVRDQPTGARWTLWHRIDFSPSVAAGPPNAPYALSLLVHELEHMRQGFLTALSVYGELGAWQAQFTFLLSVARNPADLPGDLAVIRRLVALPLSWDRQQLVIARTLMLRYAGPRYRIDLLPLYPLHQEVLYRIFGRVPSSAPTPKN